MKKILHFIGHEISEAVGPTIFFLIAFHLVALTKLLILDHYQLTIVGSSIATIGALTVAKAMLIMDGQSVARRFSHKALIWHVLWKSLLFSIVAMIFRLLEELIPLARQHGGVAGGFEAMRTEFSWSHFAAVQIWLILLIVVYTAARELDRMQGRGFLKNIFFKTSAGSQEPASAVPGEK